MNRWVIGVIFVIMGLAWGCGGSGSGLGAEPGAEPVEPAAPANEPVEPIDLTDPVEAARVELPDSDPEDAAWREGFDHRAASNGAGEAPPIEAADGETGPAKIDERQPPPPPSQAPPPPTESVPEPPVGHAGDSSKAVRPPPDVEILPG